MPPPILYPNINGLRLDWSCVELRLGALIFTGVKSVTYKHALEPGELRGTRAQLIGRTRGKYSADASVELYRQEYDAFITQLSAFGAPLGLGYMEVSFDMQCSYAATLLDIPTVDRVIGCRLKQADRTHSEGEEPFTIKCDLHAMYIVEGGKLPMGAQQMLK